VFGGNVNGWACVMKSPQSVNLRLYVGGPFWNGGVYVDSYIASIYSSQKKEKKRKEKKRKEKKRKEKKRKEKKRKEKKK
jgi:hypothetical protein